MKITKEESETLKAARFPLAVMVVLLHSFGEPLSFDYIDFSNFGSGDLYLTIRVLFSHVLSHIAVPAFFLMSGFLFFLNFKTKEGESICSWNWNLYGEKLKKRISTLLIPYLIWNVIALVTEVVVGFVFYRQTPEELYALYGSKLSPALFWCSNMTTQPAGDILGNPINEYFPENGPLWFVRDLMCMAILAPVIYYSIKKIGVWLIAILSVCYITKIWIHVPGLSIHAFMWFTTGAFFSINIFSFISFAKKVYKVALPISVATLVPTVIFDGMKTSTGSWCYPFFIASFILVFFVILNKLVLGGSNIERPICTKSCFIIYAGHIGMYILFIVTYLINIVIPIEGNEFIDILKYLLKPVTVVAVCVAMSATLSKFLPRINGFLTGNR